MEEISRDEFPFKRLSKRARMDGREACAVPFVPGDDL